MLFLGRRPTIRRLLPTPFQLCLHGQNLNRLLLQKRKRRVIERENKKGKFDDSCRKSLEKTFESDLDHSDKIIKTAERIEDSPPSTIYAPVYKNEMSLTPLRPVFCRQFFE